MNLSSSILVATFFISSPVFAQDSNQILKMITNLNKSKSCQIDPKMEYACDSMSTFSCKPGTFEDGTGHVLSDDEFQSKLGPKWDEISKNYRRQIEKMLNDSDPKYNRVRELAIKSTLQDRSRDCSLETGKAGLSKRNCYQRVASILAEKKTLLEVGMFIQPQTSGEGKPNTYRKANVDFSLLDDLFSNPFFIDGISAALKKNQKLVSDDKTTRKIEKEVLPKVKKILTEKIRSHVKDESVRDKMISRIEKIKFEGNDCGDPGSTVLTGFLVSNAFYNLSNQTFRYCNGMMLQNNSEFSLVKVVAHEISHSIDPCSIQLPFQQAPINYQKSNQSKIENLESQFPFEGLLSCLRARESVGAVIWESDTPNLDKPFCKNDQIGEVFSDWMGVEVLADYIEQNHAGLSPEKKLNGYSNVFRDSCGSNSEEFDVHLGPNKRIDRILMANPKIRGQIGCGALKDDLHYCQPGENFKGTRAIYEASY